MTINTATKIANHHTQRDKVIASHVINQINEKLDNVEWLLAGDNYSRSDENEIRYRFDLIGMMRGFVSKEERQWPSCQVRNAIFDHYRNEGFDVSIDSVDSLVLKIQCGDIGDTANVS